MKKTLQFLVFILGIALLVMPYHSHAMQVHRVAPGESIYLIAQKYDLTMDEILENNSYIANPERIFANQPLIIPVNEETSYRVQLGDSLYKIAQHLGVSMDDLAEANSLSDWSYLSVGQVLQVPEGANLVPPESSFEYTVSQLVRQFSDTFYLKGGSNTNRIALTFDDGPDQIYTPQVLDVLKEYQVPATFFLMGSRSERYPEVVSRIVEEGHVLGNHSWSHPDLRKVSQDRLISEMIRTENILNDITGLRTQLMRPPYGAVNYNTMTELEKLDYKVINWSVDSVDWRDRNVEQILINTLPDVTEEAILLFHSASGEGTSMAATVEALPELINTLRAEGYVFVTVDELLDIPAYR
ncbi:peptidoglycan/xylan/chitin deacetylase (PgdA/CDA1 family) [Desulfitispora alkaliphila]|uniref:polysaccharide deacetylase family protein n=1 Tax=Desulfitispora alkaliphila TaxID=622674 RepID=UPI003D1EFED6